MASPLGNVRTTIRLTLVSVFVIATIVTVTLATSLQYYFGQSMAKATAASLYTTASAGVATELRNMGRINANIIDLLADNPILRDAEQRTEIQAIFVDVLRQNPLFYGVYLGSADNEFFEVINLDTSERARRILRALPTDRWVVLEVSEEAGIVQRRFHYLDDQLQLRFSRAEPTNFDVSSRPWYTAAMASGEAEFTPPYIFSQLGTPGRTVSKRLGDSDVVVGIDITLDTASNFLRAHRIAGHGEVFLYNVSGDIIASSHESHDQDLAIPLPEFALSGKESRFVASLAPLKVSNELDWPPIDYAQSGRPSGYSVDLMRLIARMTGLRLEFVNGYDWPQLRDLFQNGDLDLLQPVIPTEDNLAMGLAGNSFLHLPFALVMQQGRPPVSDLADLVGETLVIPDGWSITKLVRERYPELQLIGAQSTLHALQKVLAGEAAAALDNEVVLRYVAGKHFLGDLQFLSGVGLGGPVPDALHVLVHTNQPELRVLLDRAIAAIGPEQHEALERRWFSFELDLDQSGTSTVPSETLVDIAADTSLQGHIVETQLNGETHFAYAAPVGPGNDSLFMGILSPRRTVVEPFLDKVRLSILITCAVLLLLLPLSWFFANPIVRPVKQLAAENDKVRRREYERVARVNSHVKELDELSDSMVSMVGAIQRHEREQRALMDAIIEVIAEAIDDKSAYTGGHCRRVPELAFMLAHAASESEDPAFANFQLATEDEWREFRIAAWLHDCGKITTPEHIVDKGSKLETIYNRIHEVRMRFEVLWRDAEIAFWRSVHDAPAREPELRDALERERALLSDDFAFVAQLNVGGESLDEASLDRLQNIAERTWQRNFSDRLGLSPVEELRFTAEEAHLPAVERLLGDKPEHVIARTRSTDYPPGLGIDMDIPEYQSNLGEIYNLSVSRGTLTREDRFRINEHMIGTIKMLENLPFPQELARVPRYASTHHETLRGSGYPRRLKGEQLSIPERILAIADIFEALTASDRPYKKAKPLSEALKIMHQMVLDRHIDRDCFELFLREGVYLRYAERFLPPGQRDEADLQQYYG